MLTLYELLSIQTTSDQDGSEDALQEMCRLGAILFLADVRRKFGILPMVATVQTSGLHNLLDRKYMLCIKELDHIRTSILIAGCAVHTQADRS